MRRRVERLGEDQAEELVAAGRIGVVGVEEDRREGPAGEPHVGPPEAEAVVALEDLDVLGAEVEADRPAVVDHPADVPAERLAPLVAERPELLGRVDPQLDPLAVVEESVVDEELRPVADVDRLAGRPEAQQQGNEQRTGHEHPSFEVGGTQSPCFSRNRPERRRISSARSNWSTHSAVTAASSSSPGGTRPVGQLGPSCEAARAR